MGKEAVMEERVCSVCKKRLGQYNAYCKNCKLYCPQCYREQDKEVKNDATRRV